MTKFADGDRIEVRKPAPGKPFHTCSKIIYKHECFPGAVGTVTKSFPGRNGGPTRYSVKWDQNQVGPEGQTCIKESHIDEPCIQASLSEEAALDLEMATLLGITTEGRIHDCPHCTCTKGSE